MNDIERLSESDPDLVRFYGLLDELGEGELKRKFLVDEISPLLVDNYIIKHNAGGTEERFHKTMTDINEQERSGAIVVGVNRRLLHDDDALVRVADLVVELEVILDGFSRRVLSLRKLEDLASVREVTVKNGFVSS